ncbi:putative rhamnose biosynthetic enzyme 3 [Tetrabaena socialis]|uniref:Putative rhamnose biosynthetic enzyme 3 n=1 Tax=Tetrabaena socialis TaxID=47790 RepID=A0A2J7ZK43_9CHLO|nr:putative rhamnose biosynthetic enzyme 3 [Tetrabaena socialis]|eukprot:PNH00644.1 putative rhamnose biosynthetic enzyme 3 [Tetrabaena socialis]
MSAHFAPKNILVTGGAGFIASHVVLRLCTLYPHYKVVVLDKLDYCASTKNLASLEGKPNFRFIKGDIRSMDLVSYILKTEEIDTVMHFAAQTHVDNSFGNSLAFTLNNTYGTHVLLEAARMAGSIRRFINVSTDEVYGETSLGKTTGLAESSNLDPTNPYSAAKAGAELIARAYITSYKMPIIITRGNNVYGPHQVALLVVDTLTIFLPLSLDVWQFPEKLIPKFTLLAARGKDLPVHGDGSSVRSYLYVDDVAEAFDCMLHKGVTGETYNIGTESERSVLDVARDIANVFSVNLNKVIRVKDRAFNDRRYYIGSSKLAALGWKESTSWEEGLKKTIDWYMGLKDMDTYWVGDLEMALKPHPAAASGPVTA